MQDGHVARDREMGQELLTRQPAVNTPRTQMLTHQGYELLLHQGHELLTRLGREG